jgi:hypothetical protein
MYALKRTHLVMMGLLVTGCGRGSGDTGASGIGIAGSSYAPSRFTFEPGIAGRAVGIHAVATLRSESVRSHELEVVLIESGAIRSTPPAAESASAPRAAHQALCSTQPRESTTAFETVAGSICWFSYGMSGGSGGAGGSVSSMLIFTREGTYTASAASMDVYIPPDLINFSNVASVGCLADRSGQVPVAYVDSLAALSVSTSFAAAFPIGRLGSVGIGPGVGMSVFLDPTRRLVPAVQYDTSIHGLSIGIIPIPIEVRFQTMSGFVAEPMLAARNEDACSLERSNPFDALDDEPDVVRAALLSGDLTEQLRSAADEFLAPLLVHLASEEGFGPSPHMMAGSNADAFASLGGTGFDATTDSATPPSTFDDLLARIDSDLDTVDTDQEIASMLARHARDVGNIVPSPVLLDGLLRRAAVGAELLHEASARRDSDAFIDGGLIRIDGMAGEPVSFSIEASEIASLLGVEEDAVLGSTVHLSATHTVSASEHILEAPMLDLTFTPKTAVPLLVRARVDLSTANGPLDAALEGVEPRLAHRLVVLSSGPPEHLAITAAGRVAAGGAVTLSAVVSDAMGNASSEPVEIEFFDGEGTSLGRGRTQHGVATLQYVPEPSAPRIERVAATELTRDDETFPGIEIVGSGFSVDAEITIDGELIDPEQVAYDVKSARSILVAVEGDEGTTVQLRNPGGAQSEAVAIDE